MITPTQCLLNVLEEIEEKLQWSKKLTIEGSELREEIDQIQHEVVLLSQKIRNETTK